LATAACAGLAAAGAEEAGALDGDGTSEGGAAVDASIYHTLLGYSLTVASLTGDLRRHHGIEAVGVVNPSRRGNSYSSRLASACKLPIPRTCESTQLVIVKLYDEA
jgi:hypothetical protein